MRRYYIFTIFLSLLVVGVVALGFKEGGTPGSLQALAQDQRRLSDFSTLQIAIQNYFSTNRKLPTSLSQIELSVPLKDPVSQNEYEYEVVNATSYKLCAEFATESSSEAYGYPQERSNKHKKGYDCIIYDLPAHLLKVVASPSATPASIAFAGTYIRLEEGSQGPQLIIQEGNITRKVIVGKAQILNKAGKTVTLSEGFSVGETVFVEVALIRGDAYEASKIQNLSR